MHLHSLCTWPGSFVRQAATEAAATETAKGTPIALIMSFSCGQTSHTHMNHPLAAIQHSPLYTMQCRCRHCQWYIGPLTLSIVCWHAFKSICRFVMHKLTYQLVNALYLLHDLFALMLRLHWNCYTHAGHLSDKEESLFKHAIKIVKDASQQGEQREM